MKNTVTATNIFMFLALVSVLVSSLSCTAAKQVLDFANKVGEIQKQKIDSIAKDTVYYTATVEKVDTEYTTVKKIDTLYSSIAIGEGTDLTPALTIPDWLNLGPGVSAKTDAGHLKIRTVKSKPDTVYITKTVTKTITKYIDKKCINCDGETQPQNWWWVVLAIAGVIASRWGTGIKKADPTNNGIS